MDIELTAVVGMTFALLGFAATFLMYHLWGYPFDKESRTSEAPRWAMYLHRFLGYAYAGCYVLLMWEMLPRLWEYQVEFPPRTVAHTIVGFTIGFILVVKISIMRFFRHFEEWMPYLGTALLFCTVILLGLSLPAAAQERALAAEAFSQENRARVERLLPTAGMPDGTDLVALAKPSSLADGRQVLLRKCVRCHDLKTILLRPRTPKDWYRTVVRMVDKPALFDPISDREQLEVTAYLVAITRSLQKSQKRLRAQEEEHEQTMEAAKGTEIAAEPPPPGDGDAGAPEPPPMQAFDLEESRELYTDECSLCHDLDEVEGAPPESRAAIDELIERMIENDLDLEKEEIEKIKFYLFKRFVEKSAD